MWRELFYKNITTYIALINKHLSEKIESKSLSQFFKIVGGFAFKSKEYKNQGIPVIRISDFQNEKIILDKVRFYEESETLQKYQLYEGDIIIAMTGGTIGKLAIVQEDLGKLYLNQRVGKFELIDSSLFFDKYVYWIARGVEGKVKSLAWGAAQPNVSSKKIESMEFPIPPIDIQKKIVQFLSDLEKNKLETNKFYFDKLVENQIIEVQNRSSNIKLLTTEIDAQKILILKLKQSILQEAVQGKLTSNWREQNLNTEPASELLKRIKSEKKQLIKDKKIKKEKLMPPISKEEIPFELPNGWVWCRLGDLVNFQLGKTPASKQTSYWSNGIYNWLNIKDMVSNGYIEKTTKKIAQKAIDDVFKIQKIVPKNTLLMSFKLTVGKVSINKIPLYHNEAIISIFPYTGVLQSLLFKMLPVTTKLSASKKVLMGHTFNSSSLSSMLFPLAPIKEQKAIVEKVGILMQKYQALEREIKISEANAQMLMQAVLKEAFEGRKEKVLKL